MNPLNARKGITTFGGFRRLLRLFLLLRLNPLNARKGITTFPIGYFLETHFQEVESPQCPEGHYDVEEKRGLGVFLLHQRLNPLNARKGITTLYPGPGNPFLFFFGLNPLNARKGITTRTHNPLVVEL